MPESNRLDLPYPVGPDENDVPADILALVNALDERVVAFSQGLFSARPAAGSPGRLFWATDYRTLFYDDGVQWQNIAKVPAWTTWEPTFTVIDGNGDVVSTTTKTVTELEARYRLIQDGTQCEIYLSALIAFGGTGPTEYGLSVSLPVQPYRTWALDADGYNTVIRAITVRQAPPRMVLYPTASNTVWQRSVGSRFFRVNGIFEVALPGAGGIGDLPDDPDPISTLPTGPASGDLEGNYPAPMVKDSAVRRHRLNQMAKPNGPVNMDNNKLIKVGKGVDATDAATMQNIADVLAAIESITVDGDVTYDVTPPETPALGDIWLKPVS